MIEKIDKSKLPQHIAIIMDGNGRWAKKRNLPRAFGHRAGIKSVRNVIEAAREIGIKYMSLYAFSTENWQRPKSEIMTLMKLLYQYIQKEREGLKKNDIRIIVSGDLTPFSVKVKDALESLCNYTYSCSALCVNLCLNYGARQEIVQAVNKILEEKKLLVDEKTLVSICTLKTYQTLTYLYGLQANCVLVTFYFIRLHIQSYILLKFYGRIFLKKSSIKQ